jgi:radical SAM/Cys-rich protein
MLKPEQMSGAPADCAPMLPFSVRVKAVDPAATRFERLTTLQINLGNRCNLSCAHCHVEASPAGDRLMQRPTFDAIADLLAEQPGITLDITGGCPELHPDFRALIEQTKGLSPRRIVRTNLTIAVEPGMEWLPEFYREHDLVLTASLPCYSAENVDRQRGEGVFERSIAALRRLNALGYGTERELILVYNPGAASLPGSQELLETAYKRKLQEEHGIVFSRLYTMANAPLGRFRRSLEVRGELETYLLTLRERFNPAAVCNLMCRTLISVDWQGQLYNCDFNQAAGLPIRDEHGRPLTIGELADAIRPGTPLILDEHCLACTAGEGSGCFGSASRPAA